MFPSTGIYAVPQRWCGSGAAWVTGKTSIEQMNASRGSGMNSTTTERYQNPLSPIANVLHTRNHAFIFSLCPIFAVTAVTPPVWTRSVRVNRFGLAAGGGRSAGVAAWTYPRTARLHHHYHHQNEPTFKFVSAHLSRQRVWFMG